ncbi:LLM class flavin-dependent oxidoreductase [Amycolatopsis jejuensis]|uniref:LLM class flavin-dependent oxidoreductase n=1 Tax=Amycolatopsis jejuensis TaxID=330084 RepID=UPI00052754B8|nr:LLM class flavin-dependent oxidoreductase [Amycolatopsis jejuensis]
MSGPASPWPSFGVFHQGWATGERSDAEVLGEVIRSTVLADRLGFDVAWFTEQHTRMFGETWGRIAAPQLLIAHLAAKTDRIGLGTSVRLIADQEADRLAEELLTLDLLTHGRVQFGIGAGMAREPGRAAREARRGLLRARATELADLLHGRTSASLVLTRRELSGRIHVATTDPRSIALAAREGFNYLAGMFGGVRHADLVRSFRDFGGRGTARAARMVFVAEDDRAARQAIRSAALYFWAHFTPPSPEWRKTVLAVGRPFELDDICAQLGWIVGGPASVATQLADYLMSAGLHGLDLSFHVPGLAAAEADRSMELFASAVRPEVGRIVTARPPVGVSTTGGHAFLNP